MLYVVFDVISDTSSYLSTSSNSASSLSIVTAVQLLMIGVCAYFWHGWKTLAPPGVQF